MLKGLSLCFILAVFGPSPVFAMPQAANAAGTQTKTEAKKANPPDKKPPKNPAAGLIPLSNVVQVVELVVDAYNSKPETQGEHPSLPHLATADFNFKVATDVKLGPSINLWIFKAGYTHENQTAHEIAFQYKPQPLPIHGGPGFGVVPPADLKDELTKAIESAAAAIKGAKEDDKSPLPLQLQQLVFTLTFTIANEYTGGVNIPIHLVTLGGSATYNKSEVQTVKLTFSFPEKKPGQTPETPGKTM